MTTTSRKRFRAEQDESSDWPMPGDTFSPKLNLYREIPNKDTKPVMKTATLALPGLKPGNISISLLHDKVTISGEIESVPPRKEGTRRVYTRREVPGGTFSRELSVPSGMRPEDFKARMENGLLTLTFPADPPKREPYYLPIEWL